MILIFRSGLFNPELTHKGRNIKILFREICTLKDNKVPGTCTQFVELLCYTARSLPCKFFFVPYLNEHESREIFYTEGIGFHIGDTCAVSDPSVIVVMGGLAMPGVPVSPRRQKKYLRNIRTLHESVSALLIF